jgi:adenylosuccinate lyase
VSDGDDRSVPDVLADRSASAAMLEIWSPRAKVLLEREFWIAVMRAAAASGMESRRRRSTPTSR